MVFEWLLLAADLQRSKIARIRDHRYLLGYHRNESYEDLKMCYDLKDEEHHMGDDLHHDIIK